MRRITAAVLCVCAISLSALLMNCSDEDSPVLPAHDPVIMPLAVGNVWNYADTVTGPVSAVFSSSMSVTGDTVITHESREYDVFTVEHYDTYNQMPTTWFYRNDELGLWEFGTACGMDSLYYMQMNAAYPVEIGYEWVKGWFQCDPNDYVTGYPPGDARYIAKDSVYTTPAGTFECRVYHSEHDMMIFGTFDIYTFYVPDVGMVAREIHSDMLTWKSVLVDYDLD
jgi:hypothetical protein